MRQCFCANAVIEIFFKSIDFKSRIWYDRIMKNYKVEVVKYVCTECDFEIEHVSDTKIPPPKKCSRKGCKNKTFDRE